MDLLDLVMLLALGAVIGIGGTYLYRLGWDRGFAAASDRDEMRQALEEIYANARYVMDGSLADGTPIRAGVCRWCGAPPPTKESDHDVSCPAAKAGWALRMPGYRDAGAVIRAIERLREHPS